MNLCRGRKTKVSENVFGNYQNNFCTAAWTCWMLCKVNSLFRESGVWWYVPISPCITRHNLILFGTLNILSFGILPFCVWVWNSSMQMIYVSCSCYVFYVTYVPIVCSPPPPFLQEGNGEGEGGWASYQIFKKGKLDRTLIFRGGLLRKRGVKFLRGEGAIFT